MKLLTFITVLILNSGLLFPQEKFNIPQVTTDQKIDILYDHVIAYAATGISFAKSKGTSPEDYGKFIGEKFSAFWNPEDGFEMLVNRLMFILAGMHPNNEMQIVNQDENSITFKLKNVDFAFKEGPIFNVFYQDFLDCSKGIISVLAQHMNATFEQNMTDDGWYFATLIKK